MNVLVFNTENSFIFNFAYKYKLYFLDPNKNIPNLYLTTEYPYFYEENL